MGTIAASVALYSAGTAQQHMETLAWARCAPTDALVTSTPASRSASCSCWLTTSSFMPADAVSIGCSWLTRAVLRMCCRAEDLICAMNLSSLSATTCAIARCTTPANKVYSNAEAALTSTTGFESESEGVCVLSKSCISGV